MHTKRKRFAQPPRARRDGVAGTTASRPINVMLKDTHDSSTASREWDWHCLGNPFDHSAEHFRKRPGDCRSRTGHLPHLPSSLSSVGSGAPATPKTHPEDEVNPETHPEDEIVRRVERHPRPP